MKQLTTLILLSISFFSFSQNKCGTEEYTQLIKEQYREYAIAKKHVNAETVKWIKEHPKHTEKSIITIPVVVHVVWNTTAENISDSQIQSQIEILNNDFRKTNSDTSNTPTVWQNIAADTKIEFCLATTNPQGLATTGITRTQTTETSFGMNGDPVKNTASGGIDAWDNKKYLNIWICNLGSGLLGYATPPTTWIGNIDGVVIGYKYFGNTSYAPYNKGRTTTHEIGHWLNLEHIWGGWGTCGDDQVSDTPTQEQSNYGCPDFPANPNSCQTTNTNGDMYMNYMDYTNDTCMNLFTNGQKNRMIAAINQYRSNLLNHSLCEESVTSSIDNIKITKQLIRITDVLGREVATLKSNTPLFYIYSDGTVEKRIQID